MQKRDAGVRNSAYAPEKLVVLSCVLSFRFRRQNALRAAVGSGFPSARYTIRVVLFAPVEYLTYESRKAVLPARAALRIARNDFPCKGHPKQAQSISTTTPVWQIRICTAFCKSKNNFSTNQTPGKIQGRGGAAPFLVVLRGLQRGKAPTRIQRSDSCGKRRNNGTDEACTPLAADRMRDVEFVPTQLPLCRFLFTASGFFFAAQRKRG